MIRAIEYYYQTGEKISQHNESMHRKESPYRFLYYVLDTDRTRLYERIDRRVDQMMEQGLVDGSEAFKGNRLLSGPDLHAGAGL